MTELSAPLTDLLTRVRNGEEVTISDAGKPVARIVPAEENPRLRALGMFKGKIWMSDDFDSPLSEDELKEWGL